MFLTNNIQREEIVEKLINHVEWICGPLSRETCVIEGDDDYSILHHNFSVIVQELLD